MVSNRVVIKLNEYEKKLYSSSFRKELRSALLEINARTLLISRAVREELLKEDTVATKKLKTELVEATSSLSSALNANMELAHRNKDLELEKRSLRGKS